MTEHQDHRSGPARRWLAYLANRFGLLLPILALDLILAGRLPPPMQFENFWHDIPSSISVSENVLRFIVIGLPLLMPLAATRQKLVLAMGAYSVGLLTYVAA